MKRMRGSWIALAIALSALLPMAQAHCMWMPFEVRAAAAAESGGHDCCHSAPAQDAQPWGPVQCPCFQLPPSTLPASAAAPSPASSSIFVVLDPESEVASRPSVQAPAAPVDVGSPPLPIARDAHGLRAPPLS